MKYSYVIFDVDGTLLDSFYNVLALEQAYYTCFPARKEDFPHDFFVRAFSGTREGTYHALGIPEDEWDSFYAYTRTFLTEEELRQPPFPGMYGALKQLKDRGLRLGTNTSRTADLLELAAGFQPELFSLFDPKLIVTRDMVAEHKPAPDSLLYFCNTCKISKSELLFIGDSNVDKLCAKAAGVDFAWAAWGLHFQPEELKPEDLKFHTLDEMLCFLSE